MIDTIDSIMSKYENNRGGEKIDALMEQIEEMNVMPLRYAYCPKLIHQLLLLMHQHFDEPRLCSPIVIIKELYEEKQAPMGPANLVVIDTFFKDYNTSMAWCEKRGWRYDDSYSFSMLVAIEKILKPTKEALQLVISHIARDLKWPGSDFIAQSYINDFYTANNDSKTSYFFQPIQKMIAILGFFKQPEEIQSDERPAKKARYK